MAVGAGTIRTTGGVLALRFEWDRSRDLVRRRGTPHSVRATAEFTSGAQLQPHVHVSSEYGSVMQATAREGERERGVGSGPHRSTESEGGRHVRLAGAVASVPALYGSVGTGTEGGCGCGWGWGPHLRTVTRRAPSVTAETDRSIDAVGRCAAWCGAVRVQTPARGLPTSHVALSRPH